MSSGTARDADASVRDRVRTQLQTTLADDTARQATVEAYDDEAGNVVLSFGCNCSGGLSAPEKAIVRTRLVESVPEVDGVLFGSGCGCGGGGGHRGHSHGGGHDHGHKSEDSEDSEDGPKAPF